MARVLAVDLGATSGRVSSVDLAERPTPLVVHSFRNQPQRATDGSLRWDWAKLVGEVKRGLRLGLADGPVASIGVDAWGVDYGLVDEAGSLLSDPFSYWDRRTDNWRETADRLGRKRLYATTGIQLMAPNTLFQLAVHDADELRRARWIVMLPNLLVAELTGRITAERTSAGTSALVDARRRGWSDELLKEIGVDPGLVPDLQEPGTEVGSWQGVPVHLVAGHDTASAVVALPPAPGVRRAFVASGTWCLVGAERADLDTSSAARLANFSNEPGALGGYRFLKNVVGFWFVEQCVKGWGETSLEALLQAAADVERDVPIFDPNDERFRGADDVEAEIRLAVGLRSSVGRDVVVRCILESIGQAAAEVVDELGTFMGGPVERIDLIGGGARSDLFRRLLEAACGIPVIAGSAEATSLGNGLVQGIGLGHYSGLDEARAAIADEPKPRVLR